MAIVAPSILSADFGLLNEEIKEMGALGADWIHVDVMDGRFVPNITIGPAVLQSIKPAAGDMRMDVHLMIVEPDKYIWDFKDAGADIITVHAEACPHLHRSVQAIRSTGVRAGVALNPHTPVAVLDHILDEVEKICSHVAIMKQGQLLASGPFSEVLASQGHILLAAQDMER